MSHSKPHLAVKTCACCGRPFAWRKRWARCWEEVRYCSKRCRCLGQAPEFSGALGSMPLGGGAASSVDDPRRGPKH